MAINTNISPTVSGVYTPRDFTQQLNYMSENAAKALRSAGDFDLDLQNEAVKQKQKKLIEKEYDRQQRLKDQIERDKQLIENLKKELSSLTDENTTDKNTGFSFNFVGGNV